MLNDLFQTDQPQQESQAAANAPAQPSAEDLTTTPTKKPSRKTPWHKELSRLLERAYDSLESYRSPDSLTNAMIAFAETLDGHAMIDIAFAFKEWTKNNQRFPTPADIRTLSEHSKAMRLSKVGAYLPKRWVQVIRDASTNEILAENLYPKDSLSPLDISSSFPGQSVTVSMRKE